MTTTRTDQSDALRFVEGVGTTLPASCSICGLIHGTIGCRGLSRQQKEARIAADGRQTPADIERLLAEELARPEHAPLTAAQARRIRAEDARIARAEARS